MRAFTLEDATEILRATPATLRSFLGPLSEGWTRSATRSNWGPADVLGHLIVGEQTDWIPRTRIILTYGIARPFDVFDREAQSRAPRRAVPELLEEFERLRARNLAELGGFALNTTALDARGIHPEFGEVRLGDMLATWAVHDLSHIAQIAEVMAKRYVDEVGPWRKYLPMLDREELPS